MKEFYFELRPKTKTKYYYQEVPEPTDKSVMIDESSFSYEDDGTEIGTGLCYVTLNGKVIEDNGIPRYYHVDTIFGGFDDDIAEGLFYDGKAKQGKNTLRLIHPEVKRLD